MGAIVSFLWVGQRDGKHLWRVSNGKSQRLGTIRWDGRYRKYVFVPDESIFGSKSLHLIAQFLDERTKEAKT